MPSEHSPTIEPSLPARLAVWLATGLGIGLVAPAPGTVAGLWGLLLVPPITWLPGVGAQLVVVAVLVLAAEGVCGVAARALGGGDPGAIALDEIVALPIAFLGLHSITWPVVIVGYLLFRVFDILKLGVTAEAEKLPGGWGIVADDCVAAAFAWAALRGVLWLDHVVNLNWLATSA